ncbi:MAG: IPT/TIG domain-containing protein [Ilumatobacteraceae bacterium]
MKAASRLPLIALFVFLALQTTPASAQLAPAFLAKSNRYKIELKPAAVAKSTMDQAKAAALIPDAQRPEAQRVPDASDAQPTIEGNGKIYGGLNSIITLTGTHFDKVTTVTFEGQAAIEVVVVSPTKLFARIGLAAAAPGAAAGNIVVTNAQGSSAARTGFVYVNPPTITSVAHKQQQGSSSLTINGTNFIGDVTISINGEDEVKAFVLSETVIFLPMKDAATISSLALFTPGGEVDYPNDGSTTPTAAANADINLPDFGNGLTLIPTPQFDYARISKKGRSSFNVRLWGNALGTDSTMQKVGPKFLSPDLSSFGLRVEEDIMMDRNDGSSWLFAMECNVLVKKVSYFDEKAGTSTNFSPGVIHPRLGFIKTFQHNNGYVSLYGNFPAVVGSNQQFASFFNTGAKNVFFYPELNFGYLLPVSGNGNQSLKFQLSIVDNNGDAQYMSSTNDTFLYYFKFGFVSSF